MSQSSLDRQERIRVAQACDNCRDKKSKCDGVKPVCGRCRQKSLDCHYGVSKRVKNQQIMTDLVNKVAQYESMLQNNVSVQQPTQSGGSSIDNQFPSPTLHFVSTTPPSTSRHPFFTPAGPNSDVESATASSIPKLSHNLTEMSTLSNNIFNVDENITTHPVAHQIQPPPRALLEQAIQAFFQGITILFRLFDKEEVDILFNLGYGDVISLQTQVALLQLCAVAAVGCQYFPQTFDAATRTGFLSVVKLNLDEYVDKAPLQAFRVIALMTIYFTFEKRNLALLYANMGLRLAMIHHDDSILQADASNLWQRIFRVLAFLDGWLCSTSGHLASLQSREIQSSIIMMGSIDFSMASVIQHEMIKITALCNLILKDIYHVRSVSSGIISQYITRLQGWQLALPSYMQLERLLDANIDDEHSLPILQVHSLYTSTLILVYRRSLVDLATLDHGLSVPDTFRQTQSLLEPCLLTGRQIAKILIACILRGQLIQRCWMTISSTSSTCNVLLYSVASQLLYGTDMAEIELDVTAAKQCLDVLAFCSQIDESAGYHFVEFSSIYDNLAQILTQETPQSTSNLAVRSDRLRQILLQVADHLILPSESAVPKYANQFPDETLLSARTEIHQNLNTDARGESMSTLSLARSDPGDDSLFLNDLGGADREDSRKGKELDRETMGIRIRGSEFGL